MAEYIGYDLKGKVRLVYHTLNPNMNQISEHVRNQETK